jgi:hypothetical protein
MSDEGKVWCERVGGRWDARKERCLRTVAEEVRWVGTEDPAFQQLAERVGDHSQALAALQRQVKDQERSIARMEEWITTVIEISKKTKTVLSWPGGGGESAEDEAPVEREVVNRLTPWASETGGTT